MPSCKKIWCKSVLGDRNGSTNSFASWSKLTVQVQSKENVNLAAMICWCLWNARNELVWNGKLRQKEWILRSAGDLLGQWQQARMVENQNQQGREVNVQQRWKKPEVGWLKCNVDAALFNQQGKIGLGCIIRDENGVLVAAKNDLLKGPMIPAIVEAMCCKEALSWINSLGYSRMIMELDAQKIILAINGSYGENSYFGTLIDDCKILSRDLGECSFVFSKRSVNQVAHSLAKAADSESDPGVWFTIPPLFISLCIGT